MSEHIVHIRGSREDVLRAIYRSPEVFLSNGDTLATCGRVLLKRIHTAFIAKAAGGTDEAGERWAPLSPKTIAYSRGRTKAERSAAERPSEGLTKAQNNRWWQVYRQQLARFKGDKERAARFAWTVLKGEGAVTLYEKYKGQHALILRDSGKLLDSLDPDKVSSDSVFRTYRNEVTVGTRREGASAHHQGVPGRLPQRRLWPEPRKWPSGWWLDMLHAVRADLVQTIVEQVRRVGQ
jgi:hypothetical protein